MSRRPRARLTFRTLSDEIASLSGRIGGRPFYCLMSIRKILAWGVHLYTATGLVAAAGVAVLIVRGGDESLRGALALMVLATVIDSTDGWLARRARVKEFAPSFDGRRLDDLIDFQTYTSLPLLLIWRAEILTGAQSWWL